MGIRIEDEMEHPMRYCEEARIYLYVTSNEGSERTVQSIVTKDTEKLYDVMSDVRLGNNKSKFIHITNSEGYPMDINIEYIFMIEYC